MDGNSKAPESSQGRIFNPSKSWQFHNAVRPQQLGGGEICLRHPAPDTFTKPNLDADGTLSLADAPLDVDDANQQGELAESSGIAIWQV
ncbi:hypothetical protein I350_01471 [Cryptococcus amylolentus CBS 6273]|uniref:Uncharacterized protein n=1 Tax=Cryptococcus amylolentus CBS 6273 TaxID=1296118 RepID=A0A1E3KF01_9TREE|nr:hypothetical protein I350_01471 [Cryptococcus amylolentus CBS 6273]